MFIPSDLEEAKIVMAAVYGGRLIAIEGTYDDVNRLGSELVGDELGDWGFVNVNLRPVLRGGLQDAGLRDRRAARLADPGPDRHPGRVRLAAHEDRQGVQGADRLGLVEDKPYKIFGAQAEGCSPVSAAYKAGHDVIRPVKPDTIAKSLAIGNPADGPYVLDIARRTGGAVEDVTDAEVVDAIRLLARTEGIFAETAGGVTVGVLRKLVAAGRLDPDAETVVLNTGDGLKTLDAVAGQARPTADIRPSLDAFRAAIA